MIDVVLGIEDPLAALGLRTGLTDAGVARSVVTVDDPADLDRALTGLDGPVLILESLWRARDRGLLPRLRERHPGCRVLVFVRHSSSQCVLRALLAAGSRSRLSPDAIRILDECCLTALEEEARGCIPSDADPEAVGRAVRAVVDGEIAAAPWVTAAVRHQHGPGSDAPAITPRELEVMALVAEGCSNKEIGRRLSIREQTVKNHLRSVMPKMGVNTRLELGLKTAKMHVCLSDDGGTAARD